MPIKLQKEAINVNEVVLTDYSQTKVDGDIIVPDIKPDILKVLHVEADVCVVSKAIQQDRVILQGDVKINILYTPDGDVLGKAKNMTSVQSFTHVVDIKNAKSNMELFVEAEAEKIEHMLINSRKINTRVFVGVNVKVTAPSELSLAVDIEGDERIEKRCSTVRACNVCCEVEKDIIIREALEVPAGKPDMAEMLKINLKVGSREIRLSEDKAMVKGEIEICSLYAGNEDEDLQFMEHSVEFNEVLDINNVNESMDGELDYFIKEVYHEILEDSDGDKRVLNIEVILTALVKAAETLEIEAIEDVYALKGEIEVKRGEYNIEQLVGKATAQAAHRDTAVLGDDMPAIMQIFNCITKPFVTGIRIENGKVLIEGIIDTNILYLSRDDENPVCSMKFESNFTHTTDITGVDSNMLCDAKIEVLHVSYNMTMDREIELRYIIGVTVKAVMANMANIIEEIVWTENPVIDPRPSIVIYFVQKGDTLWDIAKRYKTTIGEIMANNNLDSDKLAIGQQLML